MTKAAKRVVRANARRVAGKVSRWPEAKPRRSAAVAGDDFSVGSGNVFADIKVRNPEEALVKAKLVRQIAKVIDSEHLTQTEAARRLGIDQPKVSMLLRGRLNVFSTARLIR